MRTPAVLAESVTVKFRPFVDRKPTLRKSLGRLRSREATEIVAVDDVSFTVPKGEAFGIIGRNGAGKSTLLRCLAGTLQPNSGRIVVNGRTSTLLQLGVGFIPELSGRRNVYLGGLAAGMRKRDIDERFDQIVAYSELGEAIQRPVKTYSTGMFSRLAFSVAIHQEPDVLFLDEVLAVGDEAFREKSMESMKVLLEGSGTIIFVSHALGSVSSFCDNAAWMADGRIRTLGSAGEVVKEYRRWTRKLGDA